MVWSGKIWGSLLSSADNRHPWQHFFLCGFHSLSVTSFMCQSSSLSHSGSHVGQPIIIITAMKTDHVKVWFLRLKHCWNNNGKKCTGLNFTINEKSTVDSHVRALFTNMSMHFPQQEYLHILSLCLPFRAFPLEYSCLCDTCVQVGDCYIITSQHCDPGASSVQYA